MRQLEALNSQRYFCECGIGERDNCPAPHVTREVTVAGSRTRQYFYIASLALAGAIVFGFSWLGR